MTQNVAVSAPALADPRDASYQIRKRAQAMALLKEFSTEQSLKDLLRAKQQQQAPRDDSNGELTRRLMAEAMGALGPSVSPDIQRNLLGSAAGGSLNDGSPLIRQDLEPVVLA